MPDKPKLFKTMEEALREPANVIRLSISLLDPDSEDYDRIEPAPPFPDGLEKLVNLKELNIAWNDLTEIPAAVFSLTSLELLDISGNSIPSIPDEIGALKNLTMLDMGDMYFKKPEIERELVAHLLPDCQVNY